MTYARWSLLVLFAATASAQETPTARQILEQVRAAYTAVRQYEMAGNLEVTKPRLSVPFRIVYRYPDKLRLEGSIGGAQNGGILITDGTTTWSYNPARKTYTQSKGLPDLDPDMDDDELKRAGIDPSGSTLVQTAQLQLVTYRKLAALAAGASLLRVENLQLAGAPTECYVVEVQEKQNRHHLWVDTKRFRILRLESNGGQTTMRMSFDRVTLNEPVPDDAFSFVPPADARQVEKQQP
jgi:outer membrane lipoprotein-sorting protein